MTESNSVELFNVEFFLTEKLTLKVEIPLFWGFVPPSDFPKSGGDPVYVNATHAYLNICNAPLHVEYRFKFLCALCTADPHN